MAKTVYIFDIWWVIVLAMITASCGVKKNSRHTPPEEILALSIESPYCQEGELIESPLMVETRALQEFSQQKMRGIQLSFSFSPRVKPIETTFNWKNPKRLSEKRLRNQLERLRGEFQTLLKEGESGTQTFLNWKNQFSDYIGWLNRWQSQQCQLETLGKRKKKDVRSFKGLNQECSRGKSKCRKNQVLNLCSRFQSPTKCRVEYYSARKRKKVRQLSQHYMKRFEKEAYQKLFQIQSLGPKFKCEKLHNGVVLMTIDTYLTADDQKEFVNPSVLFEFVEKMWSENEIFQLKLRPTTTISHDVLQFHFGPYAIPHVKPSLKSSIFLRHNTPFELLQKQVSHELGHILGFHDCYIEFYDQREKEIVYYELLDKGRNIMCGLDSKAQVPSSYFEQLIQNRCQMD